MLHILFFDSNMLSYTTYELYLHVTVHDYIYMYMYLDVFYINWLTLILSMYCIMGIQNVLYVEIMLIKIFSENLLLYIGELI